MIKQFIDRHQINPALIAWHGHTIFHDPLHMSTYQLGEPAAVVAQTGRSVAAHFRNIDVALGGQGAPLAPLADEMLMPKADAYLNLGGISNITFRNSGVVISYDIGPCNQILNALAREMGLPFDNHGSLAASGQLNPELLRALDRLPYYQTPPPKSIDNNWIVKVVRPIIDEVSDTIENKLHTCTVHIAEKISEVINSTGEISTTMVTGGGVHNDFLLNLMRQGISKNGGELVVPDQKIIDFKEAALMALMGYLYVTGKNNVMKSVTGASRDHIGGCLYQGWINNNAHG